MPGARATMQRAAGGRAAFAVALALAAASPPAAIAQPVVYRLIPELSWVHAEVLHFGTSTLRMRFGPVAGDVTLDRSAGRGEVGIEIDTGAVDTGFAPLDARLREPDLLATREHPRAWFVASRFVLDGDVVRAVTGELTLRGVSRPLTLRVLRFACRPEEGGGQVCGGDFEGFLRRTDFGASFGVPLVGDGVRLVVLVQARRL